MALVALHAAWLRTHRSGGPLDIDEAAYLTLAFQTTNADHRIVTGPLILWQNTGALAPLVPLTTAPLHLVLGRSIEVSHLTNLVFFPITVVATYLLARRLAPAWWAALAATVVATAPAITDYTRHYHYALAATATFTVALLALVRSRRLDHRGWSLAFGVALGAVLLSRTYLLAFVPGLVLAAAVLAWRAPDRRRTAGHLLLALVVGGVLAGSWYLFSAPEIWDYLTGYGYGDDSSRYGAASVTSLQWWLSDAVAVVSDGLYLPFTIALAVGAGAGLATVVRSRERGTRRSLLRLVLDSDAFPLLVAIAAGFAALLTSRNQGTGFVLPLLPASVVLAVALTARARPRTVGLAVAVALCLVATVNVTAKAQVLPALDDEVAVRPASWAMLRVTSGESVIDRYLRTYDADDEGREDGWLPANRELYHDTIEHAPADDADPEVLFLVEGPNLNSTVPGLFSQIEDRRRFVGRNLTQADTASADELTERLRAGRDDGSIDQVVTGPETLSWPELGFPEELAVEAARAAGFVPAETVALPNGDEVTLWVAPTG
mgnify:CR=1 FL=1